MEIGNYLKFTYHLHNDHYSLGETELIYGHTKIKRDAIRLNALFLICFIANNIFPERQAEPKLFNQILRYLKNLNNRRLFSFDQLHEAVTDIIIAAGFLTREKTQAASFNLYEFVEEITNTSIKKRFAFLG